MSMEMVEDSFFGIDLGSVYDAEESELRESDLRIDNVLSLNSHEPASYAPGDWSISAIPASTTHQSPAYHSAFSNFSSPATFVTASTPGSFLSARSAYNSPVFAVPSNHGKKSMLQYETIHELEDSSMDSGPVGPLARLENDYNTYLSRKHLVLPPNLEREWSGRGQHVTFQKDEDIPLKYGRHLGASATASVDRVLCRRIVLARKSMQCSRVTKIADALREVEHLQKLRHFHIVQLVGTYLQGRTFAILMYPAADYHLGKFLEETADLLHPDLYPSRFQFLRFTIGCLSSAVEYIHRNATRHMDIKPANILVKHILESPTQMPHESPWRVYLADFGLSRSFVSQEQSQTDGPTGRTPRYCAPEVYSQMHHGRSADIFSLGCVFSEILTVCGRKHVEDFSTYRRGAGQDDSYHNNLPRVKIWIEGLKFIHLYHAYENLQVPCILNVVDSMLEYDPKSRPKAARIVELLSAIRNTWTSSHPYWLVGCCHGQPEKYVKIREAEKLEFGLTPDLPIQGAALGSVMRENE